jgi:hypothetical protein
MDIAKCLSKKWEKSAKIANGALAPEGSLL